MRTRLVILIFAVLLTPEMARSDQPWLLVVCKDAYSEYYESLQTLMQSKWSAPESLKGIECIVKIEVDDAGIVTRLQFDSCPDNEPLRESVRKAVGDAGPIARVEVEGCRDYPLEITFQVPEE